MGNLLSREFYTENQALLTVAVIYVAAIPILLAGAIISFPFRWLGWLG
jgi:preprotein translocase subunit SecY